MKTLQGLPVTVLILGVGGSLMVNLGRVCKDLARITCESVDPGWGQLTVNLEGSKKTLQGLSVTVLILGGQLMANWERIHEDLARITCDSVDPGGGGRVD